MLCELTYKIADQPRKLETDPLDLDYYDVEWTHKDGFPPHTIEVPEGHPPNVTYKTVTLTPIPAVIHDQITVRAGSPRSLVIQIAEEKGHALARALNIAP